MYVITLDIQDVHNNVGYDFFTHITKIHNEIMFAHQGELQNFKFHQYSLLIHLILYQNFGHISTNFIEGMEEFEENLLVQWWTTLWHYFYPYSSSLAFYNDFANLIMNMLGSVVERFLRIVRKLVKPNRCWDEDKKRLDHEWGSVFLMENYIVIRVFECP